MLTSSDKSTFRNLVYKLLFLISYQVADISLIEKLISLPVSWDNALSIGILIFQKQSLRKQIIFLLKERA